MSLTFAYHRLRTRQPIHPLGGVMYRPAALVHVTVFGPAGSSVERGRLDTGADDTVFPVSLAARLGIDLTSAPVGGGRAASGAVIPVRYVNTTLRLTDGIEHAEWVGCVAFADPPFSRPLFGHAGFLQFFEVLFRGAAEEVVLTADATLPGRVW
jgi:hypothetical protein